MLPICENFPLLRTLLRHSCDKCCRTFNLTSKILHLEGSIQAYLFTISDNDSVLYHLILFLPFIQPLHLLIQDLPAVHILDNIWSGKPLSGEGDEFFEKRRKFRPTNSFARQSFAHQDNKKLSKWLVSLVGSLVLHLKTLLLLMGETFRRAKVTNFLFGDENFARRIVSPDENFARQSFAR